MAHISLSQTNHLKMIVVKGDEVLTPGALANFDHAIALILNFVLRDDLVTGTQQLRDLQLALLRTEGVVVDVGAVLTDQIEIGHVPLAKLLNVLNSESNDTECSLKESDFGFVIE